jgi:PAS domain S-box-containing protein
VALRYPSGMSVFHHATDRRWLEAAFDSVWDGILVESNEHVVYANAAYARLLGYRSAADLVPRRIAELIADSDAQRLVQFSRLRASGKFVPQCYDFAARRSNGSSVRLQASVSVSKSGPQTYITTIVRPFTAAIEAPNAGPLPGSHDTLSPRERQVMEMLLAGTRPKTIALELKLTENTVATHRARLLEKMGVSDTRELFQYALRHRLVDWS